jgi:hypothetical protein
MAGAALLASGALGDGFDLERLDPITTETTPPGEVVARYAALRREADRLAAAVLGVGAAGQGTVIRRSRR